MDFQTYTLRVLAAGLLVVGLAGPASADSAKALGRFGSWQSFTYSDKAGKVCYATVLPKSTLSKPNGRKEAFLSVTHRPQAKSFDVVSITEGFAFKKDAPIEMDVGGDKFDLYSQDETAWTKNDKAVVQAMAKAKTIVVHGTPAKGNEVVDTYSLDGFAKAYAAIGKACDVK